MLRQKILEIIVLTLALITIVFAIASCIYKDNVVTLRVISGVLIVITISLNFYANYNKKKL